MTINNFNCENYFLSNFYYAPVYIHGVIWPSTEHFYQAMKTSDVDEQENIRMLPTPGMAKRRGQKVKMRDDWEDVKYEIMHRAVFHKFSQHPDLTKRLLDTGDEELIEGNTWGDKVWGVCDGEGTNWLGEILMEVRKLLRGRLESGTSLSS